MTRLLSSLAAATLLVAGLGHAEPYTPKHEAGRCAIRGQCGSKSWFGKQLPCVDNGLAEDPDDELRLQLVDLCGAKWSDGPICCNAEQVKSLKNELATAKQIISTCPACKDNFYNLFCTFTCSPDQSLFINVTRTMEKNGKTLVTELDQLISEEYGSGFYDSCKDVKFGPSNSNAMAFIGGGAKNYTEFLKFLGDEKAIGSPFQINYPREYEEPGMAARDVKPKKCNDEDPNYRCACVDCPAVCPELPAIKQEGWCKVGVLPCLSFAAIFTYSILLFSLAAAVVGHMWSRRRAERRLLQNNSPSDDEDEGDLVAPPRYYRPNNWCGKAFAGLGHVAARFPAITIVLSLIFVSALSMGWVRFDVEREPAKLWVSPSSPAAVEKDFFDSNFGPFYRTEKIFLVNDTQPSGPGPALSYDTLLWWMEVEKSVQRLKGPKFGATLHDVCLKPTGSSCVVQSVTAYFGNEPGLVDRDTWQDTLRQCANSPVECRPDFGLPIDPSMILGGYESDPAMATAMTVTWVVNNFQESTPEVARAMDWEEAMKNRLLEVQAEAATRGLRVSFSTEISLEEELNKSTNTDAKIVVISYVIMFMYASIALGSTTFSIREFIRNSRVSLVQSKFTLGTAGIIIVLMSISSSVGLFSWSGIKATLIIAEVIPFIVLAVGVDNIFLIVHEFERVNQSYPDDQIEERISKALGRMGPSILLSATTETVCFAMGAFVGMPAVRNFAVYAAGAVFINAVLQVTMFVSVLTLNQMRVEDYRADCFPCIQVQAARIHLSGSNGINGAGAYARSYEAPEESLLEQLIRKHYAPNLLGKKAKLGVVMVFLGLFAAGVALIPEVKLGLDQRVAIPDGSYLIPYFNDLYDYFEAGPPLYFVAKDLDTTRATQREICARFTTCEQMSLANILEGERKRADISYISSPTASWIDDYFQWLNPELESCCKEGHSVCFKDRDPAWNITLSGMPEGDEFMHYLTKFLSAPADDDCPLGGKASYGSAVVVDTKHNMIPASHFRTSHSPLRSQDDFINAMASARRVAKDITKSTGVEVFPYSVFYIFFDQYATIVSLTATLLCTAVGIIFVVTSLLLGSVLTGAVVTGTVIMTVVDILGCMALFGVSLNAVSLVNLIICVGIAVEFCAHIARAFMFPSRVVMDRAKSRFQGRDARAWAALVNVGGSVFSGITLTKLLGVCVLAFTRSKIFEIYYFRIWLSLVVLAALHALVFLPVALSLAGGEGYDDPKSEGGIEEYLATRRYRDTPDSDSDSDEE